MYPLKSTSKLNSESSHHNCPWINKTIPKASVNDGFCIIIWSPIDFHWVKLLLEWMPKQEALQQECRSPQSPHLGSSSVHFYKSISSKSTSIKACKWHRYNVYFKTGNVKQIMHLLYSKCRVRNSNLKKLHSMHMFKTKNNAKLKSIY